MLLHHYVGFPYSVALQHKFKHPGNCHRMAHAFAKHFGNIIIQNRFLGNKFSYTSALKLWDLRKLQSKTTQRKRELYKSTMRPQRPFVTKLGTSYTMAITIFPYHVFRQHLVSTFEKLGFPNFSSVRLEIQVSHIVKYRSLALFTGISYKFQVTAPCWSVS